MDRWQELLNNINYLWGPQLINRMGNWAELENYLESASEEQWKQIQHYVVENWEKLNVYAQIYAASALLAYTNDAIWMEKMLDVALDSNLPTEELYFLKSQLNSWMFVNNLLSTSSNIKKSHYLYERVRNEYRTRVKLPAKKIPIKDRNEKFILVLTGQMLSLVHGPTKSVLDRCKVLIENIGKEVLLVNTAESSNQTGKIPLYRIMSGNYIPELKNRELWEYKGCEIPYVQLDVGKPYVPLNGGMPQVEWIQGLLDLILEYKPYQIVVMGGGAIVGELCSAIVDTMVISFCPSALVDTQADYQQIGRPLSSEDETIIQEYDLNRDSIISGVFTSDLKEQQYFYTRQELGIPKERFVAAVVGARLDEEVSEEFLHVLTEIVNKGYFIVFMGKFDKGYEIIRQRYDAIHANCLYLGMVEDILAHIECCDIYLNPTRRGGGTSSVEALSKGVPVITVGYGDVYTNVSDEFAVENYSQMIELASYYMTDKKFYQEKSFKAKQRAEVLLDTEHAFVDIMNEFENRMLARES